MPGVQYDRKPVLDRSYAGKQKTGGRPESVVDKQIKDSCFSPLHVNGSPLPHPHNVRCLSCGDVNFHPNLGNYTVKTKCYGCGMTGSEFQSRKTGEPTQPHSVTQD